MVSDAETVIAIVISPEEEALPPMTYQRAVVEAMWFATYP